MGFDLHTIIEGLFGLFYVAEKVVKLSSSQWNDILTDAPITLYNAFKELLERV